MRSTRTERGWSLSTRVAFAGAVACALAGTLAASVGGYSASWWITHAEHRALLRITHDLADELVEELAEAPEDDSPEEHAHFARAHGERNAGNMLIHELEVYDLHSPHAAIFVADERVAGIGSKRIEADTCVDDPYGTPDPRRYCAVPYEQGVLVLSVAREQALSLAPVFLWAMALGALSGAVLGGLASYVASWWALRPIERLREQVARVREATPDAAALEPPMEEVELEELRLAVADLLGRLTEALVLARTFAAEAAHELRTPLTTLSGEIDLLGEGPVTSSTQRTLRRRVDTLVGLVQRLLALATPEGALDQTGLPVDLQDVLDEVLADRTDADRIQVRCAPDVVVRGDEHLLQLMISNALDNALKFSDGTVWIEIDQAGGKARIDVLDEGPGVDEADRERVFEPFVRSASSRNSTPGHGVGLALIRRVASLHGGTAALGRDAGRTRLRIDVSRWGAAPADDVPTVVPATQGRLLGGVGFAVAGLVAVELVLFGLVAANGRSGPAVPDGHHPIAGLCEASAVIEHQGGLLIADNEAERRLFRFDARMEPVGELRLPARVEDIEALAPSPQGLFVVGSHSRNKKGERRPDREIAVQLGQDRVIGVDLTQCAACMEVAERAPKKGGISIEGAAWWNDALWLGMRSPLVGERALLLRMAGDPLSVVEERRVDLGGRGIRDLRERDGALWILAGAPGTDGPGPALFEIDDGVTPEPVPVELPEGAEGFAWREQGSIVVVTDGDGKPGESCKQPATWTEVLLPPDDD